MQVIEDFIRQGRKNRPGYKVRARYITIHDTANPNRGADALAHARYLHSDSAADRPISWHLTVDDRRVVQHLPLDENGWHAGDGRDGAGNRQSIGVEICENADGDRARAERNAARLVARLLKELNLGPDAVVQHSQWNGKNCPRVLRSRPGGWESFLDAVRSYWMERLTPIMADPVATLDQARELLRQRAPDWVLMADLYWSVAPKYRVRPDIALAQACKETGYFRFGGLVQPWQNNFAGIAATGVPSDGKTPLRGADPSKVRVERGVHGAIFVDRATGVEAHVQHLYAYATTDPLPAGTILYSPRFALVRRGSAPYVEWLGAAENPAGVGWAWPGYDYGKSIVRDYLELMLAIDAPSVSAFVLASDYARVVEELRVAQDKLRRISEIVG